ncbi:MAG: GNVR domain-containing protein [Edaphobacter sp.]|uniref:GumC family protein n=1 Tax=Edaphobacter sp. TaxID=1934404 RepID=UPI002393D593|nr:GNVR domain-containing protein [Edaphobacter sp.]MDE1178115.1 GNVR domain-containing protein [Edaphobacter sp.]
MLGHRALNVDDYLGILKRRGWIIAVPAVLLTLVGLGLSYIVPPKFVSQTLVLVEQQKVPEDYVKPVIEEDLTARLASMKEQILSRSRLQPIIERFNLYGTKGMSMDDRIDQVRKDINIKPIHSEMARTGGLPGFFIAFTAADARTAQLVCGEITSLFVSQNLNARAQSAEGTTDFLKGQLDDAKRTLDEQDAKLAAFQQKYMGRLPGEEATNMNMMTSLNTQLEAATQQLARLQQDRSYVEAMLAQQQTVSSPSGVSGTSSSADQAELQSLLTEESDLTKRYTADYPDVIAVHRKIKEVRARIEAAPAVSASASAVTSAPSRNDSPGVQQLRAQLKGLEQGIIQKQHEQSNIQSSIRMYQGRISSSPVVLEEYKNVTRDYQTAQSFYDDLLKKMNSSKMATDLERRQQGEQFRVMDEPNLPDGPTFPKRGMFVAAGLFAGLILGVLIVAWREYRDTVLRSERDVWAFTHLPTLGVISFTGDLEDIRPRRKWLGRSKPDLPPASRPLTETGA